MIIIHICVFAAVNPSQRCRRCWLLILYHLLSFNFCSSVLGLLLILSFLCSRCRRRKIVLHILFFLNIIVALWLL